MTKQTFFLVHEAAKQAAHRAIDDPAHEGWMAQFSEPTRTGEQNSAQWPYLEGFAKQKQLCINGTMVWATSDDWKDVLTGCFNGEMRMAAFDGKVIMLPQRTSKMGKRAFCEWFEFLMAMAAQAGVEPVYKNPPKN